MEYQKLGSAFALGAFAIGEFAIGEFAIGEFAIGDLEFLVEDGSWRGPLRPWMKEPP